MTRTTKAIGKASGAKSRTGDKSALSGAQLGAVTGGATSTGKVSVSEITIAKTTDSASTK